MTKLYDRCFALLIGHEGGFTDDRQDRGNWTSGKIGVGQLKGTKYGISAMSYPHLDIRNLTLDEAKAIYRRDFWDKCGCSDMAPALALVMFDTAVNSGPGRAAQFLAGARDHLDFLAARLEWLTHLATWPTYGKGWARRVARLMAQAADVEREFAPPPAPVAAASPRVLLVDEGGREVELREPAAVYAGVKVERTPGTVRLDGKRKK